MEVEKMPLEMSSSMSYVLIRQLRSAQILGFAQVDALHLRSMLREPIVKYLVCFFLLLLSTHLTFQRDAKNDLDRS